MIPSLSTRSPEGLQMPSKLINTEDQPHQIAENKSKVQKKPEVFLREFFSPWKRYRNPKKKRQPERLPVPLNVQGRAVNSHGDRKSPKYRIIALLNGRNFMAYTWVTTLHPLSPTSGVVKWELLGGGNSNTFYFHPLFAEDRWTQFDEPAYFSNWVVFTVFFLVKYWVNGLYMTLQLFNHQRSIALSQSPNPPRVYDAVGRGLAFRLGKRRLGG